MSIVLIKVFL